MTTVAELETLDEAEMVCGYRDGFKNAGDWTRSDRAYWHGYLKWMVDGGHAKGSPERWLKPIAALRNSAAAWFAASASPGYKLHDLYRMELDAIIRATTQEGKQP